MPSYFFLRNYYFRILLKEVLRSLPNAETRAHQAFEVKSGYLVRNFVLN